MALSIADLIEQIESIFDDSISLSANLNQISSVIFYGLPSISWAGFYIANNDFNDLRLGAFVGRVACTVIKFEQGVVGHSYSTDTVVAVNDVHKFKGHIACDSKANSEICIPVRLGDQVWGILDLDSEMTGRFAGMEEELEKLGVAVANLISNSLHK